MIHVFENLTTLPLQDISSSICGLDHSGSRPIIIIIVTRTSSIIIIIGGRQKSSHSWTINYYIGYNYRRETDQLTLIDYIIIMLRTRVV